MSKAETGGQVDRHEAQILSILREEGRLPVTDLAARIGLSKTPTQARLKNLQDRGVIRGFRAVVDPEKLGLNQVAFVEVRLADTREAALAEFAEAVRAVPEVEECHLIAGAFDYLLKVRATDMAGYRDILGRLISALPHVASTSTHVSMEAVKDDAY